MLKIWAIGAIIGALLLGRPCMSEQNGRSAHTAKNKASEATPQIPPLSAVINPPISAPCNKENPCYAKDASAEPPLPRWIRSEWVIVYVTIAYAIIAWITLRAIKRQADTLDRQNTIVLNEKRPRLLIEPQPFTGIINGIPDIRILVKNIGGSKAIFGLCIAGMEAIGLEEVAISKNPTSMVMLKRLTNKILESEEVHEERIDLLPMVQVFPPGLDKSKPYKLHIWGSLNFKDILFEDTWVREFHYMLVSMGNVYMVQFGKMSNEFWYPMMEEEDRKRIRTEIGLISRIRKGWISYKAWVEKQESEY